MRKDTGRHCVLFSGHIVLIVLALCLLSCAGSAVIGIPAAVLTRVAN